MLTCDLQGSSQTWRRHGYFPGTLFPHCKKRLAVFPSPAGMIDTDILAGDGKTANLFTVYFLLFVTNIKNILSVPHKCILWPVKLNTFLNFRTMNWTRLLWAMVHAPQLAIRTLRKVTRAVSTNIKQRRGWLVRQQNFEVADEAVPYRVEAVQVQFCLQKFEVADESVPYRVEAV
jgi:hypothetical protein